jgi:hypothetical protein
MEILANFPGAWEGSSNTMDEVKDMAAKEFERPVTDSGGEDWGLIHGDLWTGK